VETISQAFVVDVDQVAVQQIEVPVAGPDDVIIEVQQCGICGSDLGYAAMGGLLGPGVPMRLGHELSGTVVEAGSNVQHVARGDRVVMNPEANGNRIGNSGAEGGFTPLLLIRGAANDPQAVTKLPDTLNWELGALVEPLSVSMHGVHQGRVTTEDRAVVFGAGPIGLGVVLVLKYYGVKDIVVVDLSEHRLAAARELGAETFKADDGDLSAFLLERHGSAEVMGMPVSGTDVYFEATGAGAVFDQAVNLSKMGARIVVLGVHKVPVEFDLINLLIRELTVTGSMAYPVEFPQVIEMLTSGKVDPSVLVSHRFPLSEFTKAFQTAQDQGQAIKVLVDCQA